MELVEKKLKLARGVKSVEIILSGCWHLGHGSANEDAIRAMIKYIKSEPNRRLILMGDITDGIGLTDKRYNPLEVAPWLSVQDMSNRIVLEVERAIDFIQPIRDQVDAVVLGNHCAKPRRTIHVDIHRMLTNGIGAPSLGMIGFMRYVFSGRDRGESRPVSLYLEHGSGGAGTVGVVLNKMVQRAKDFPGTDIVGGAHHHRSGAVTADTVRYDPETGTMSNRSTLCVTAPSFMDYHFPGRESYAEQMNMSPHSIGPGKIVVRPWENGEKRVGYAFPYWA